MAKGPLGVRVKLSREFKFLGGFEKLGKKNGRVIFRAASLRAAKLLRDVLVDAYLKGLPGLAPLHPFTIDRKGGATPLVGTGRLARAVELLVVVRGSQVDYMVGFSAPRDAAQAGVLEFGASFKVTPKMRAYLAANGLILRASTKFIIVPPRPIFRQVIEKACPQTRRELCDELQSSCNRLLRAGSGSQWDKARTRLNKIFR